MDDATPVEQVTKQPHRDQSGLGTMQYTPSERERPFFKKLDADEIETGSYTTDYNIATKNGKYVGWFGIVRNISEDQVAKQTTLTIEHKYFDGLTDAHIQALSFNGSGDFQAILQGVDHPIRPLTLVKVYGKATVSTNDAVPRVGATFVRNWTWGTFTFLDDYGTQRGSEKWRKLNRVDLDAIYDPYPDSNYYAQRLAGRPDFKARPGTFFKRAVFLTESIHPGAGIPVGIVAQSLVDRDESQLEDAIDAAGKLNAIDVTVVVLVEALQHEEDEVRVQAAETLATLHTSAAAAVPSLVNALRDENEYVRSSAASALGECGVHAITAVPGLIAVLKDDDSHVRYRSCEALGKICSPARDIVPALIAMTKDEDHFVRWSAVDALAELGAAAFPAIESLIHLLDTDEDESVQWLTAESLGKIDVEGRRAIPALIKALQSQSATVRRFAARGLEHIGPKARTAVPALERTLDDQDAGVRLAAAAALWTVDRNVQAACRVAKQELHDGSAITQMWAAEAVTDIGAAAKTLIPELIQALTSGSHHVRGSAAKALGSMGTVASDAIRPLEAKLEDADTNVQANAALALWKICKHPRAIPQLITVLHHTDPKEQRWVLAAIAEIGPPAKEAVPTIKELLTNPQFGVSEAASEALSKIGPATAPRPSE